jgi:hypothetical protein
VFVVPDEIDDPVHVAERVAHMDAAEIVTLFIVKDESTGSAIFQKTGTPVHVLSDPSTLSVGAVRSVL